MAEGAEEFLRRRREIEEIIEERIGLLDDRLNGVQRALVEFRAVIVSEYIHYNSMLKILRKCISGAGEWDTMVKEHDRIVTELNVALASLRGKLSEEAIPEDAHKDWVKDARKRLSGILGSDKADFLVGPSFDWEKIIGFPGQEV